MSKREASKKGRRWGRRAATKDVAPRILVLCEGAKTEVGYFSEMKRSLQIPSMDIKHRNGMKDVIAYVDDSNIRNFNEIWCVVDHDERNEDVRLLINRIKMINKRRPKRYELSRIEAIISVPCFEYWLLIHFEDTTRAYRGIPGKSACKQVTKRLKTYLPDYNKADPRIYSICYELLETAIVRAKKRREPSHSSTDVWKLIERLRKINA